MPPKNSGVASKAKRAGARTVEVGMLAMLLALQATIGGGLNASGTLLHNARGSLGNMWSTTQGARYVVDAGAAMLGQKKTAADDDEDEDEDELHAAVLAESDLSQAVRTESAAPSPTNASFISEAASCAGSCGTITMLATSSNHNAAAIVMAAFAAPLAHAAKGAAAATAKSPAAATAAGSSKTVLDHIVSFLPWRDAARARQTSRMVQRAVEESVVRFFRLPKTQAPAAFVYAQCAFDAAAEQLLEASLARDHGKWVCTLCGYDNLGRRVVCGNKQCQLPAPHMRGVVRLFMGQLRRDGTAPFLRWLLEDVIADPTTAPIRLRCVEAHRDPHTQRGKGCGWAYLDDGAMVQRVVAAHKRIFPDVDATGREGVWFVPAEFKDALVEEIDHNIAYAPGRPQALPRGPFVVENPASGNGAPQPAAVPAAFSSRCGNADVASAHAAEVPPTSAMAAALAPAPAPAVTPKVAAAVPAMPLMAAAPAVPMPGQAQLAAHYHATVAHMQHAMRAAAAAAPGRVYTTLPPLQAPAFRALDDPCYVPRPRVVYRNEPYAASAAAAAVARQFQPALDFLGSQLHMQPLPVPSVAA